VEGDRGEDPLLVVGRYKRLHEYTRFRALDVGFSGCKPSQAGCAQEAEEAVSYIQLTHSMQALQQVAQPSTWIAVMGHV